VKYCRFESENGPLLGAVQERDGEFWVVGDISEALALKEGEAAVSFEPRRLSELALLPPVTPTKIICVGRNYRDHAKELGNEVPAEPLLFFKPLSSLLSPGGVIRLPQVSERVDFEGELAVVIDDVTARDLQKKDGQWTRAKGFDTFCPVGPVVDTDLNLDDLSTGLTIETRVNGEVRQHGSTADFIFTLPVLLEYITAAITLEPGDLLLTGTPAGVGPIKAGDVVEVSIPGLGRLSNPVQPEAD